MYKYLQLITSAALISSFNVFGQNTAEIQNTHVCICVFICMYICMYVRIFIYIHIYIFVCVFYIYYILYYMYIYVCNCN